MTFVAEKLVLTKYPGQSLPPPVVTNRPGQSMAENCNKMASKSEGWRRMCPQVGYASPLSPSTLNPRLSAPQPSCPRSLSPRALDPSTPHVLDPSTLQPLTPVLVPYTAPHCRVRRMSMRGARATYASLWRRCTARTWTPIRPYRRWHTTTPGERGSEGAREGGSEGAREGGSEGARERGSEGARERVRERVRA